MNSLASMITMVRTHLLAGGHDIRQSGYLNASRNYFIQTDKDNYLLKWNMNEFKAAGRMIPELGAGPGMTLSLEVYQKMKEYRPTILFGTNNDDKILSISYDEFGRLSENYVQFAGEVVRVVLTKSLAEWNTPIVP